MDMLKYKDDVLGKDVAVKFRVGKRHDNHRTFLGTVRRMQLYLDEDNVLEVLHQVIYQDGDEEWYDLEELEESGRLAWLKFGAIDAAARKPAATSKATTPAKKKPRRVNNITPGHDADDDDSMDDSEDDSEDDDEEEGVPSKKRRLSKTSSKTHAEKRAPVADAVTSGGAPFVSPAKPEPKRKPIVEEGEDVPQWVLDMFDWMTTVKHGSRNTTVSETNARSVIRQVKKLVKGEGITYKNWEEGIVFYEDEEVDLTFDFEHMLEQAKQFEALHGKDKGNGWLMQHPITKLELYKEYRKEKGLPLE